MEMQYPPQIILTWILKTWFRSPMSLTPKSSLHGVKPGLVLIFSDTSIPTVEFSFMFHLIKMTTQCQELITFNALQILLSPFLI